MKFARFATYGLFSNWGSYTEAENELLSLEGDIAKLIKDNQWIVEVVSAKQTVQNFLTIQTNNSVLEIEMQEIGRKLREIKDTLASVIGKSPTFRNHQPDALVGEIRTHLAHRKDAQFTGFGAKVIHYQADLRLHNAANFHALLAKGQKVLWALDVDGYLSIGDPIGNKHSVVAVGHDVKGAGIAQLKIDQKTDTYLSMVDQNTRALALESQARETNDKKKKEELVENAEYLKKMAKEYRSALGSWTPPANSEKIIELDFDSGHYAPREAWKESTKAWNAAGYKVVWSSTAKFV